MSASLEGVLFYFPLLARAKEETAGVLAGQRVKT
jgi:hypothetical protein